MHPAAERTPARGGARRIKKQLVRAKMALSAADACGLDLDHYMLLLFVFIAIIISIYSYYYYCHYYFLVFIVIIIVIMNIYCLNCAPSASSASSAALSAGLLVDTLLFPLFSRRRQQRVLLLPKPPCSLGQLIANVTAGCGWSKCLEFRGLW